MTNEAETQEEEKTGEDEDPEATLSVEVPGSTQDGPCLIRLDAGTTTTFCGANGSGKTRLAVYIEAKLGLDAHRISAHRALSLNPQVEKISEQKALSGLRTGSAHEDQTLGRRNGSRWGNREAVQLLNDFDYLIQTLFAEQTRTTLQSHRQLQKGDYNSAEPTKFEKLSEIWERLLPHRTLVIDGDDINVRRPGTQATYTASEMSDGERAIFYLIGQTLVARKDSVLIIDEPELHLHQSIMAALWGELASARSDCAFVFITHSLEFAASRPGAKFIIRDFDPWPTWTFDPVPKDTGFSEQFVTLILGSRRPVLFVEGGRTSLDLPIFQSSYPDHLVLPLESCEAVIHAVVSMRNNATLTRVTCHGIIDRDHRSPDEIKYLRNRGVEVLPVAEIENIILLPEVSTAIAAYEGYRGRKLSARLCCLSKAVFKLLESGDEKRAAVVRYTTRRIDYLLKRVDLSKAKNVQDLKQHYNSGTKTLDISAIAAEATEKIQAAIDNNDLAALLEYYDNKGLLNEAAKHLKKNKVKDFEEWLGRVLDNGSVPKLNSALRKCLPNIPTTPVAP